MKILNDWTVGGSLLLIGAGFFSTRFSDVLAYRIGSLPSQLPLLGGMDVTVGRIMGIVPRHYGPWCFARQDAKDSYRRTVL